jgi:endonuclease I
MRLALTILATTLVLSTAAVAPAQVINEYVAAHTGTDDHEYIEILGAASTDYSGLAILEIEGDSGQNPGTVDSIVVPGTTDGNGRWVSSFLTDEFEDDAMTLLLVSGFSGSLGQDLDTDDDGVFDITPWTSIRDEVGVQDETAGIMYTTVVLLPGSDGLSFGFGGGSRLPDGTDTDTASDWQRNDWNGAGLPGFSGSPDPNDALNTPGTENLPAIVASGPVLNEFVINHSGADTAEFVEIHGDNGASYSDWSIVVIDGDHDVTPGRVDFVATAGTTDGLGVWSVTTAADALPDGSCTILLARNVTATVGDDLDTNDDGSLDLTPWTDQGDAVAVTDGDPGDVVYATIVLESNFDGGTTPVWGASRIPSGFDSGSTSDWWRNDFEGAGLDGLVGSLEAGDAVNTAGWTNRVGLLSDYYATVDAADPTTLRTTLHQAIDDHVHVTYSSSLEDVWDVLEYADEDPADDSQVLTIYHNRTFAKFGGGQGPYNREHSWPRSYGFKDDGPDNYPHDDCHHLFASDVGYNSARGSRALDDCSASCAEYTTDANNGQGGVGGPYPGDSNWQTAQDLGAGTWEVWTGRRGDIARAILYMDVRYEGDVHAITGSSEPELIATEDRNLLVNSSNNYSPAYMAVLSTLLAWHVEDPVDDWERRRNDRVQKYQGNRNPFVDHPEWVACLYQDVCSADLFSDGFEDGTTDAWTTVSP